jgi:hypothetical protein
MFYVIIGRVACQYFKIYDILNQLFFSKVQAVESSQFVATVYILIGACMSSDLSYPAGEPRHLCSRRRTAEVITHLSNGMLSSSEE